MTSIKRYLLVIPLLYSGWCFSQTGATSTVQTPLSIHSEICKSNPAHSYQVVVPTGVTPLKQLPLLVSIDSHGDGKLAVNGFKEGAQQYKFIVVGSNLIKNNDASYIRELEELIADVRSRYPIGNTLYIGGFSGGARMAIGYASSHPVNGVIACGALAQPEEILLLKCNILSIIGMDDFNFMEAAQYVVNPDKIPSNLAIETTNASHAWPDKKLLTRAAGYLLLSTGSVNTIDRQLLSKRYVEEQKHRIDSLNKANEIIRSTLIAHNMSIIAPYEKEGSFHSLFQKLTQQENYQSQIKELNQSLQFESKVREGYYNALQQKDSVWWKREIEVLNSKVQSEKDLYTLMAYRRIKGFLGIVCYSLCNRYTGQKDTQKLEQVLPVYRMIEPDNEDMKNFSKVLQQLKTKR